MFRLIQVLLSILISICLAQLTPISELPVVNEQALEFEKDLLSVKLGDISTDLQLEYANIDKSVGIKDLNVLNNALLLAIYNYGQLRDVKAEVKRLFELYRSSIVFDRNESLKAFQSDRIKIGMKISFIMNRSDEIAKLYEKFIKIAIKYAKILKNIEDPDSEKNPKKWKDVAIEDRAELIKLIYSKLFTCTELIDYCDRWQADLIESLTATIDVLKKLKGVSTMANFVSECNDLSKNQWEKLTKPHIKRNINILSDKLLSVSNPTYTRFQKHKRERDSFKGDIRKWKEKAYDVKLIEDSDSDSTQFPFTSGKKSKFDIELKRMVDESYEEERGIKKIKIDRLEIDNSYMYQILEFVQDERGLTFGFDNEINSIPELNEAKTDLLDGKREYDLLREDLKGVKAFYSELNIRYPGNWLDVKYRTDKLNIGKEIWRIDSRINELGDVYADAFGLASSIIKELKDIVNEPDPDKKWVNVDLGDKEALLTFVKDGLVACTKLIKCCNNQKLALTILLNKFKEFLNNQELEKHIESWQKAKSERSDHMKQIKSIVDKLSGKKAVKTIFDDQYCECRKHFKTFFNSLYIINWKERVYQVDDHLHHSSEAAATIVSNAKTDEEYQTEIEEAKVHDLFMNDSGTDSFDIIKNLDRASNAIVTAISSYGEMKIAHEEVRRQYSDYRSIHKSKKKESLKRFEQIRRTIGIKINYVLARINMLAQFYKSFIKIALRAIKTLSDIVEDPNILLWSARIGIRMEFNQILQGRLIPSTNLLEDCNLLQRTALSELIEMRTIFNDYKNASIDLEIFLNKFDDLLRNQRDDLMGIDYKHKLDSLSFQLSKMTAQIPDFSRRQQRFSEADNISAFKDVISRWRIKANADDSDNTAEVIQNRKRKITDISERVTEQTDVTEKNSRGMEANKLQINNENLFNAFALAFKIDSTIDLNLPKRDLLAAIDEYDSMFKDLGEAKKSFRELTTKVPKQWRNDEYKKLKLGVSLYMSQTSSRVDKLAEVYEDVVGFATNIIKELESIVFEEDNLPLDFVDSNDKKILLEIANTRLIACTRLLEFCIDLKQEISFILIEVKNLFSNSNNSYNIFINNFDKLRINMIKKLGEIKLKLHKLSHSIALKLARNDDEYGRYEFNKFFQTWKSDITNWKISAFRGVTKSNERKSPTPVLEVAYEEQIKNNKAEIERAYLHEISTDVISEYGRIDPSVRIDDLGVTKDAILSAISKYGEMLKTHTDVNYLISDYKASFQRVEGLEHFKDDWTSINNDILTIVERTYDVDQAYSIFIGFSLKVIKVIVEIVESSNDPWENVPILQKARLIEIVNRRLVACANLLQYCNELQLNILNALNPMIDIFSKFEGNIDTSTFQIFLEKYENLIANEWEIVIGDDFRHKISLLFDGGIMPQTDQDIYVKRRKYDEEEGSFIKAIDDWKAETYQGEIDNRGSSLSSVKPSTEPNQKNKRTKLTKE